VGIYTHVLDQWGIVYDQPLLLNERQAGVAIEGVVRQTTADIVRIAVDSHGFTDFGIALAKLLGFDLCPRLKNLRERRLHLPTGHDIQGALHDVLQADVSLRAIRAGWDELLRLAASILRGEMSAVYALERFGAAARGDRLYRAGTELGRLLRTVYLCDYFSNAVFRREIHRQLAHGESTHSLQRAIYAGRIDPKRGRRDDELRAISASLALLTNIVMAWNTHRLQTQLDARAREGKPPISNEWLARVSPAHHVHINFRGVFQFDFADYTQRLLSPRATRDHSAGAH
jgi:TnpA family transposase